MTSEERHAYEWRIGELRKRIGLQAIELRTRGEIIRRRTDAEHGIGEAPWLRIGALAQAAQNAADALDETLAADARAAADYGQDVAT